MKLKRLKQYKAQEPYYTIQQIRKILYENNIFTTEKHVSNHNYFNSCRVNIENENLSIYKIGTNGKGMNSLYSLASAYGEFMERLQNQILFKNPIRYATHNILQKNKKLINFKKQLNEMNLVLDFRFTPDEKNITLDDINKIIYFFKKLFPNSFTDNYAEFIKDIKLLDCIIAPFYNANTGQVEELPLEWLIFNTGSNGMCAGNTKEEAIIQGINEIFERFVLQKLYTEVITPPTISNTKFQDTEILNRLKKLENEQNILFEIKDCSLGIGLPVIGLLLINKENNTYVFHLGSDNSPITALERCYTEIFQGFDDGVFKKIDFNNKGYDFQKEFFKTYNNGSGHWQNCIFQNKPSYNLTDFEFAFAKNDTEDLAFLKNKIKKLGYTLYIRDVSFLNFDAFYLYIPGMSDTDFKLDNFINRFLDFNKNYYSIPTNFNIKQASNEELYLFALVIENDENINQTLFPYNSSIDNQIDKRLLLTMLWYKLEKIEKAFYWINNYVSNISNSEIKEKQYYFCLKDFLFWKQENNDTDYIKETLNRFYEIDLINEVINDMSSSDIFKYFNFPNCFDCATCNIKKDCSFIEIIKISKNIQEKMKTNLINQKDLSKIEAFKN